MEDDLDEEDMEDVKLEGERERHWEMFSEDNYGVVYDNKELLHANIGM